MGWDSSHGEEEVGEDVAFISQPALMLQTHVQWEHFVKSCIPHCCVAKRHVKCLSEWR